MLVHSELEADPQQAFMRVLLSGVQDLVAVLTADGRFVWGSPSAERVLGFGAEELRGRSALEMVHPADLPDARALLERTIATPEAVGKLTYRIRHRDGSWRVMEATGKNLLHDPLVGGIVLSARDVTERVRAAQELEVARAAAEQASRAKTEFLSRVSHELRTPLNAILGFAQLLESEVSGAGERESVEQIVRAGRHLLHLIDEVLEISRIEEGRLALSIEPVSPDEAVRQAVELLRPQAAEAGVRVRAHPAGDLHLLADLQRLRQVLINLLGNAIKYNRRGGRVEVRVLRADADRARIEVEDTGIGIAPERLGELFTPFERLGAERLGIEGFGLGLAVCRRLVERMDGSIEVESREGEGSTFRLELPLAAASDAAAPLPAPGRRSPPPPPPLRGTVLLVEDNPGNVRLMERLFSRFPELRLLTATSGQIGLDLAALHRPDLLLLDLHLPDMSGEDLLARLRALPRLAGTPVIVVTADVTALRSRPLAELGPRAIVTKPFDVDALLREVAGVLDPGCSAPEAASPGPSPTSASAPRGPSPDPSPTRGGGEETG